MALEKILVGDDQVDFAKKNFPFIPNAEVDFVSSPEELIQRARTGDYSIIVTDLNYTENGQEGYKILEELRETPIRKVLWTGNAYDEGVRQKGQDLGAEVLDKDEIGALVGQVVSKAPLKQDGKVLVYVSQKGPVELALRKAITATMGGDNIVVSSDLKGELSTGQYGLVIDTSTMMPGEKRAHGVVAHDMKYIKLSEVPRVAAVHDVTTVVADVVKIAGNYLTK